MASNSLNDRLRWTVSVVAVLNLFYFFVESSVASAIGSVALFADSIDFLEDATVNLLVLVAVGWSAVRRRFVGILLAGLLLLPAIAAIWTAWAKLSGGAPPDALALSATAVGALAVNLTCALMLARVRTHGGSLSKAAFLSARNDVAANIAILVAGLVTLQTNSIWPDILVGVAIALLNAGSAKEVFEAALGEQDEADIAEGRP